MLQSLKNIYHFFVALTAVAWYRWPSRQLTLIGVTGTDGKTTTTTLIYHILKTAGKKVAMVTSVAAYIGNEKIDTGFHVTSPDPWSLQRLLRRVADDGYQYMVLEVTSHALDQHRILGCHFQMAVFTNITHEHLDYHHTLDQYIKTKAKLTRQSSVAILNQGCEAFLKLRRLVPSTTPVVTYGFNQPVNPLILRVLHASFPARYNQENALASATTALELDLPPKVIAQGLRSFTGVPGRLDAIANNQGLHVIIDFAHTPNALKAVLTELKRHLGKDKKLIAVFGAAGLRDRTKRPIMGRIASQLADVVILTAEDPRTEDVNQIIDQITSGDPNFSFIKIPDRQAAINYAIINQAKSGDTIGIFGKGHEQSMCFSTTEYPWSDHKAAQKAITQRQS